MKEKKLSLSIHQKIRGAGFVSQEVEKKQRFKYWEILYKCIDVQNLMSKTKGFFNREAQRLNRLCKKFDWSLVFRDFGTYLLEASIGGVAINFALSFVFGLPFTVFTTLAYGVLEKQILSFYWKLKQNGATTKLL